MKIKALAATLNKFSTAQDPDFSFTEENLKAMAESSAGIPGTLPIWKIMSK